MSDLEALQGLWRIESSTFCGEPIDEDATHYLIAGNSLKEIGPEVVDDGDLQTSFLLDESASPRRLIKTMAYKDADGPGLDPLVQTYVYRLEGDSLTLCYGEAEFPEDFSDENSKIVLVRDHVPARKSRRREIPPLDDDVLGTLRWDKSLDCYLGNVEVGGNSIEISLIPFEGKDVSDALVRARQVIGSYERYRALAADYATADLLPLKNEHWLEEGEEALSAEDFRSRLTIQSVSVDADGGVTFWHDDDDLFCGHSIQVRVDAHDTCIGTDIPG